MVWRTAKWIGAATWHANHSQGNPGRDTGASRRLAIEATKAARDRHCHQQRERSGVRSPAQGGHTSVRVGAFWQCSVCMKRSRSKAHFEAKTCGGSVRKRWWCKSAQSILEHSSEHASQHRFQHIRMISGDIIWCTVCGSYGEHQAPSAWTSPPLPGKVRGDVEGWWTSCSAQGSQVQSSPENRPAYPGSNP